jgi:hypothetical protein
MLPCGVLILCVTGCPRHGHLISHLPFSFIRLPTVHYSNTIYQSPRPTQKPLDCFIKTTCTHSIMSRGRAESPNSGPSSESSSCKSYGSNPTNATSVNSNPGSRPPSPACKDTTEISLLRQTLATRQSDRKYDWITWGGGTFKADALNPDHPIIGFQGCVSQGVTSEQYNAGLNKFDIHPEDDAEAKACTNTISDLCLSLMIAVNECYAASQQTKEVREAERATALEDFKQDLSQLEGSQTVGDFKSKVDDMEARFKERVKNIRSTIPATAQFGYGSQASDWTVQRSVS